MNEDERDEGKDQDLAAWLRLWKAPGAPGRLRERLKASGRAAGLRGSFWKRLRRTRISLPLPVAALIVAAALGIGLLAGRQSSRRSPARGEPQRSEGSGRAGLANLRPLAEVEVTILKQGDGPHDPR